MTDYTWEQFNEVFNLTDEAAFDEVKCLGSTTAVIEITLNYPDTADYRRRSDEQKRELYSELFIDLINKVHEVTGTVTQTNMVFEYGDNNNKIHLHGFIEYYNKGSIYGLLEQIYKHALKQVKPGRGRENSWERTRQYPYPCLSCPYICMNIGLKENFKGWGEYIQKNAFKILK